MVKFNIKKMLKVNRDGLSTVQKVILSRNYPEEISDYQADMMLHALGADHKSYKTYKTRKYYHAYRNHYDAGGKDVAEWEDLVSKGYAEKHRYYHVSVKGIHLLEYLTQCRIYDDCNCVADCKSPVLIELMKDSVSCGYGCWLPTSSHDLFLRLAIPQKLILETLKELAEEGLVHKGYYGEMDDEGFVHCVHGWYLSGLAKEKYAKKYEALQQAEYKRINDSLRNEEENNETTNL